jgi:hypothetical protein
VPVLRWILIRNHWNPSRRPSSPLCRCATTRAESTVPEGSPKTAAPFGAFIFTGGALDLVGDDTQSQPNCLTDAKRHRRPLPSQGEWNQFPTSPRCRRWTPCRVWWIRAPVTAYSGGLPPWAGRAAVIAPRLSAESPRVVHSGINDHD